MTLCPRCGTQNPPHSRVCALCGTELAAAALSAPPGRGSSSLGRTVAGYADPSAVDERPSAVSAKEGSSPEVGSPHFGGPLPADYPGPAGRGPDNAPGEGSGAPVRGPVLNLHSTIVGLAPTARESPATAPPLNERTLEQRLKTMLGLAPQQPGSGAAGSTTLVMQRPEGKPELARGPEPEGARGEAIQGGHHARTLVGVARPGIAPINPLHSKPSPPSGTLASPAHLIFPSPPPPPDFTGGSTAAAGPSSQERRRWSLPGVIAVIAALVLAAAATVLLLWTRGGLDIEARPIVDSQGKEQLQLRCAACPDGTRVQLASKSATFLANQAVLQLDRALSIGAQTFPLTLKLPGSASERAVSLSVRLDYRVKADAQSLQQTAPSLSIIVDAVPGSSVRVAEQPVALDARGHAVFLVDVSSELTGGESQIRLLERTIRYSVTPPQGAAQEGQVSFRTQIVPLFIEAPGSSITTDAPTFILAGRTQKGARVSVGDRALSVDAEGRFAQTMNVSKVGETTISVRASADERAPRSFPIRVQRVASLAQEATLFRARATTSYAAITTDVQRKRGWKVVLEGSVLESRNDQYSTLMVLDTSSGCVVPPCLTKVVYGNASRWSAGDKVSVFGSVAGSVDGPRGAQVPEVVADFILKAVR